MGKLRHKVTSPRSHVGPVTGSGTSSRCWGDPVRAHEVAGRSSYRASGWWVHSSQPEDAKGGGEIFGARPLFFARGCRERSAGTQPPEHETILSVSSPPQPNALEQARVPPRARATVRTRRLGVPAGGGCGSAGGVLPAPPRGSAPRPSRSPSLSGARRCPCPARPGRRLPLVRRRRLRLLLRLRPRLEPTRVPTWSRPRAPRAATTARRPHGPAAPRASQAAAAARSEGDWEEAATAPSPPPAGGRSPRASIHSAAGPGAGSGRSCPGLRLRPRSPGGARRTPAPCLQPRARCRAGRRRAFLAAPRVSRHSGEQALGLRAREKPCPGAAPHIAGAHADSKRRSRTPGSEWCSFFLGGYWRWGQGLGV